MANDPSKAELWPNANVLVAPLGSAKPANLAAAFSGAWDYVGCLDGDAGIGTNYTVDKSDKFAWGGILMRTTRRNDKLVIKFTAFEGANDVIAGLVWPGSEPGLIKKRTPERILVAFELIEGDAKKRLITHHEAEVEQSGEIKDSEGNVTGYAFEATIFPDGNGGLMIRQPEVGAPTLSSLSVSPSTLSLGEGEIGKLTATATYSDSSTEDVSSYATWESSDEAKATVEGGYVTGVAAGTSTVTASLGDESDDCTVTVTGD